MSVFKIFPFILVLITFILFVSSKFYHDDPPANDKHPIWPNRAELLNNVRDLRKVLLVYATGNPAATARYREYAEKSSKRKRGLETIIIPDTAVTDEQLKSFILTVIGTPASNRVLKRIVSKLPMRWQKNRIVLDNLMTLSEKDVLTFLYPNPMQLTFPLVVVSGNTDATILQHLETSRHRRRLLYTTELTVRRAGQGILLGRFKQENKGPWQIDFAATRNYIEDIHLILESGYYKYFYHGKNPPTPKIRKLAERNDHRFTAMLDKLGASGDIFRSQKIGYHLYETAEEKGLVTGNTDLSHSDYDKWQVHVLFSKNLRGDDFFSDAKLVYRKVLGESKLNALREGFAMYFTQNWGGNGYRSWAKLFYNTQNANSLTELLDNAIYARESYLFMRPLAGSLVAFLVEEFGWDKVIKLYQTAGSVKEVEDTLQASMNTLDRNWRRYLSRLDRKTPVRTTATHRPVFQKGFCYAHEGYQIYNGYVSHKSYQALQGLRDLGTDWISVTPFGYLPDASKPDYFRFSSGAGSENDESVVTAMSHARELGMQVMLKPHVLMSGGHWGWPGDVKMQTEEDWERFFDYYYRWIRHYAVLAEMYEMDIFCIGVELVNTTRQHQNEWREMIQKIRKLYKGPLVYAANWGEEIEHVQFWDALDYIGLNSYYPLSNQDSVTDAELKAGARKVIPLLEELTARYKKPVLLTEVGFTSTAQNWKSPYERSRGSQAYFADQVRCYQAIFEAFWEQPWFYGFYWWKWPTYLEYGGKLHNGFTPNGKPAADVVRKWYSRKKPPKQASFQ